MPETDKPIIRKPTRGDVAIVILTIACVVAVIWGSIKGAAWIGRAFGAAGAIDRLAIAILLTGIIHARITRRRP